MSNLLTKSFDDLNFRPQEHNRGSVQLTIPKIDSHGRRLYYGIETTEEWLMEYAKADFRKRGHAPDRVYSDFMFLCESLRLLQWHSGMHTVSGKTVFRHGVPIPPLHVQTQLLPKSRVVIVAIYSSGSKWFANQPTRAQVDKLQRIMGGQEAKWWVSDM